MAKIDSKNLVLYGVGTAYMLSADGTVQAKLGSLQNMTIEITSTIEDVFGGDSLFPIFNFIKEKGANFKFTNACFDLDVMAASQGVSATSGGVAIKREEVTITSHSAQLSVTSGVDTSSVMVMKDGVALNKVDSVASGTNGFTVTAAGALSFTNDVTGTVTVDYLHSVTDGTTVDVLTNSVPGYVQLRHESFPTELPNGRKAVLTTVVYKARCEGSLSLDYSRGEAVAPELSFKSVDPGRSDHKFVSYSLRYVD